MRPGLPPCPSLPFPPTEKQPAPTSNQVSHQLPLRPHPFSLETGGPHPSQLRSRPYRWTSSGNALLPNGADDPGLVGGHRGPRHYSAGSWALFIFLLPTRWQLELASILPPTSACSWGTLQRPSIEYPQLERGPAGPVGGRLSCRTYLSLLSRDRLWELFLEVRRATEVSWSIP